MVGKVNSFKAIDKTSRLWREECEAREWLKRGYTTKAKVEELMIRIMKIRGKDSAEKLRENMRAEYIKIKKGGKSDK